MGNKASQPQAETSLPTNEVAFEVIPKKSSWRGLELRRSRDAKKVPPPLVGYVYEHEYRAKMSDFQHRMQAWRGARIQGRFREATLFVIMIGTGAVCMGLYWDKNLSDSQSLMCFAVIPILVLICVVVGAAIECKVAREASSLKSDTKDIFAGWEPSIQTTLKEVRATKGGDFNLNYMTHFNLCFVAVPLSASASIEEGEARRDPVVATTSDTVVSCSASDVPPAATSAEPSAATNEIHVALPS